MIVIDLYVAETLKHAHNAIQRLLWGFLPILNCDILFKICDKIIREDFESMSECI